MEPAIIYLRFGSSIPLFFISFYSLQYKFKCIQSLIRSHSPRSFGNSSLLSLSKQSAPWGAGTRFEPQACLTAGKSNSNSNWATPHSAIENIYREKIPAGHDGKCLLYIVALAELLNFKRRRQFSIHGNYTLATAILAFQQFLNYFQISFFTSWPLILETGTEQSNYMIAINIVRNC